MDEMRHRKQSIPKWTAQKTKQIVKSGRSSANLEVIEQMWKVIPFYVNHSIQL